jgi:hypothetical protein
MEPRNETPESAPNEDGFQIVSPEPVKEEPAGSTSLDQLRAEFEEEHGEPVDWTNPDEKMYAFGARPPAEEPAPSEGEAMFQELLAHLESQLFGPAARDEKRHNAQMEMVGDHLRAAMAEADLEQNGSADPEAETLAWGIWKSDCGCLHFGVSDGKGGWAKEFDDVDPQKLAGIVQDMAQSLAQSAMSLLVALAESGHGGV